MDKARKKCVAGCGFRNQFRQCIDKEECDDAEFRLLGDGQCLPKCPPGKF